MKITEACIKNPVFAWMLMLATVVFGGVAATRIGISQFPDVDTPTVSVSGHVYDIATGRVTTTLDARYP